MMRVHKRRTSHPRSQRIALAAMIVLVSVTLAGCSVDGAPTQGGKSAAGAGNGVNIRPSKPFVPSDAVGELPGRKGGVAAAMNVVNNEVFASTSRSMKQAADAAKLPFTQTVADGDPAKSVDQLNSLLNNDVGAVYVWDVDPAAQRPAVRKLMDGGAAVFTLSSGPSTMPMVGDQKEFGDSIGATVKKYINEKLGGKAKVVMYNLDKLANIKPRFDGIRSALASLPGVKIVSDVQWDTANPDSGFTTMSTILQATPDVNVVIGPDTVVLSAYKAVKANGKDLNSMAFFGQDGEPEALSLISEGGPYKATYAFNFAIVGYAAGVWGADWIAGKTIPSLTIIKPVLLDSADAIARYQADYKDPASAFSKRLDKYLQPLGGISFKTRMNFWNENNPQ